MVFRRKERSEPEPPSEGSPADLRDGLGLHYLWYFGMRLQEEVSRGSRVGAALSVAAWEPRFLDAGLNDEQLVRATALIAGALRPYDVCSRISPQRFIALLPDAEARPAETVAFRIRQDLQVHFPGTGRWNAGVSAFPADGEDADTLVRVALARLEDTTGQAQAG